MTSRLGAGREVGTARCGDVGGEEAADEPGDNGGDDGGDEVGLSAGVHGVEDACDYGVDEADARRVAGTDLCHGKENDQTSAAAELSWVAATGGGTAGGTRIGAKGRHVPCKNPRSGRDEDSCTMAKGNRSEERRVGKECRL